MWFESPHNVNTKLDFKDRIMDLLLVARITADINTQVGAMMV